MYCTPAATPAHARALSSGSGEDVPVLPLGTPPLARGCPLWLPMRTAAGQLFFIVIV